MHPFNNIFVSLNILTYKKKSSPYIPFFKAVQKHHCDFCSRSVIKCNSYCFFIIYRNRFHFSFRFFINGPTYKKKCYKTRKYKQYHTEFFHNNQKILFINLYAAFSVMRLKNFQNILIIQCVNFHIVIFFFTFKSCFA